MKRLITTIGMYAAKLASKSGLLSSLYYAFASRSFYREHRAVLAGIANYLQTTRQPRESSPELRRNIHRLEKGLLMRPPKPVFAEDFIGTTVDRFVQASTSGRVGVEELDWAADVLATYFGRVEHTPAVASAYERFARHEREVAGARVPYPHKSLPAPSVTFEQLQALAQRRRSVRWYLDRPVAMDDVRKAVQLAALAPSACNRQSFRYYVATERDKVREIAECAVGTGGFAHNLPCVMVAVGEMSAYRFERDRHLIYIDASLANMQLMLALETLGLSSCPINWADIERRERRLARILGLTVDQRPVMMIGVGYADPDGGIAYSQKKPDTLLVREI